LYERNRSVVLDRSRVWPFRMCGFSPVRDCVRVARAAYMIILPYVFERHMVRLDRLADVPASSTTKIRPRDGGWASGL
jgi:hypothetical protein